MFKNKAPSTIQAWILRRENFHADNALLQKSLSYLRWTTRKSNTSETHNRFDHCFFLLLPSKPMLHGIHTPHYCPSSPSSSNNTTLFFAMRSPSPCLSSTTLLSLPSCSFLFSSLRPRKLFQGFRPLSSLRETKKVTLRKVPSKFSQNLYFDDRKGQGQDGNASDDGEDGLTGENAIKGTIIAGLLLVGVVGGFGTAGYFFKDQINAFLTQLSSFIDGNFHRRTNLILICNILEFRTTGLDCQLSHFVGILECDSGCEKIWKEDLHTYDSLLIFLENLRFLLWSLDGAHVSAGSGWVLINK